MAPTQKLQYFRELLNQDFDMPEISRFVLGPYWRMASSSEQQQFTILLSDDLVRFYRQRFTRYEGETFEVTGSRSDPAGNDRDQPDPASERATYRGRLAADGAEWSLQDQRCHHRQRQHGFIRTPSLRPTTPAERRPSGRLARKNGEGRGYWRPRRFALSRRSSQGHFSEAISCQGERRRLLFSGGPRR